jgi:hypothetical protein
MAAYRSKPARHWIQPVVLSQLGPSPEQPDLVGCYALVVHSIPHLREVHLFDGLHLLRVILSPEAIVALDEDPDDLGLNSTNLVGHPVAVDGLRIVPDLESCPATLVAVVKKVAPFCEREQRPVCRMVPVELDPAVGSALSACREDAVAQYPAPAFASIVPPPEHLLTYHRRCQADHLGLPPKDLLVNLHDFSRILAVRDNGIPIAATKLKEDSRPSTVVRSEEELIRKAEELASSGQFLSYKPRSNPRKAEEYERSLMDSSDDDSVPPLSIRDIDIPEDESESGAHGTQSTNRFGSRSSPQQLDPPLNTIRAQCEPGRALGAGQAEHLTALADMAKTGIEAEPVKENFAGKNTILVVSPQSTRGSSEGQTTEVVGHKSDLNALSDFGKPHTEIALTDNIAVEKEMHHLGKHDEQVLIQKSSHCDALERTVSENRPRSPTGRAGDAERETVLNNQLCPQDENMPKAPLPCHDLPIVKTNGVRNTDVADDCEADAVIDVVHALASGGRTSSRESSTRSEPGAPVPGNPEPDIPERATPGSILKFHSLHPLTESTELATRSMRSEDQNKLSPELSPLREVVLERVDEVPTNADPEEKGDEEEEDVGEDMGASCENNVISWRCQNPNLETQQMIVSDKEDSDDPDEINEDCNSKSAVADTHKSADEHKKLQNGVDNCKMAEISSSPEGSSGLDFDDIMDTEEPEKPGEYMLRRFASPVLAPISLQTSADTGMPHAMLLGDDCHEQAPVAAGDYLTSDRTSGHRTAVVVSDSEAESRFRTESVQPNQSMNARTEMRSDYKSRRGKTIPKRKRSGEAFDLLYEPRSTQVSEPGVVSISAKIADIVKPFDGGSLTADPGRGCRRTAAKENRPAPVWSDPENSYSEDGEAVELVNESGKDRAAREMLEQISARMYRLDHLKQVRKANVWKACLAPLSVMKSANDIWNQRYRRHSSSILKDWKRAIGTKSLVEAGDQVVIARSQNPNAVLKEVRLACTQSNAAVDVDLTGPMTIQCPASHVASGLTPAPTTGNHAGFNDGNGAPVSECKRSKLCDIISQPMILVESGSHESSKKTNSIGNRRTAGTESEEHATLVGENFRDVVDNQIPTFALSSNDLDGGWFEKVGQCPGACARMFAPISDHPPSVEEEAELEAVANIVISSLKSQLQSLRDEVDLR